MEQDENDPLRPVVGAFLDGPLISDEDLVDLGRFGKLQRLSLLDSHISDAGMDHLRGFGELRWLYLSRTPVTDRGLEPLKGLSKIQELGLHRTRISDAGLAILGGLKGLRILDIKDTATTDAGLAHLQGLVDLRKLDLRETRVTDAGMKSLRGMTRLWSLSLAATRVGDAGLADLEGLTRLQSLDLSETRITDAGLEHLKGLTNLQALDLSGTEVTDSGLRAIRKALPDATIVLPKIVLRQEGSLAEFRLDVLLPVAMMRETEMVFAHIAREDRPILELIDSVYTFVNEKLAELYGITGVTGAEMRKVTFPKDSPRGGVLTHAGVLMVTSNPDRTSPVKRGQFILDNILGTPAPPPPPDIPALEESKKDSQGREPTVRELMVLHRSRPVCISCHARMDPLGLALENFNAFGLWHAEERGRTIDASGQLITGESLHDVRDLKRVIKEKHRLDFYRCLTEKMLTYALGRGLEPRLVFERLLGAGPRDERRKNLELRRAQQQSILDFIREDTVALGRQLGRRDQQKLDQYLSSVREIKHQIQRSERFKDVPNPAVDPPAGVPVSYQEHSHLMFDMMVLAFQTDSTHIATFLLAGEGSNRSFPEIGIPEDHHNLSHHLNRREAMDKVAEIDLWYMQRFVRFLEKLEATQDVDGKSVLSNSMIVYGSGNSDGNHHTHTNLPIILAGCGGGALSTGGYVQFKSRPMSNLYLSLLDRMGVDGVDRLGDSTGRIEGI